MGLFSVLKSTSKTLKLGVQGLNSGLEEVNKGLEYVNQELSAWNEEQQEKQPLKDALHTVTMLEIRLNSFVRRTLSTFPYTSSCLKESLNAISLAKQFLRFGIENPEHRKSVLDAVRQLSQVFVLRYGEVEALLDEFSSDLKSNPNKLEAEAKEVIESGIWGEALESFNDTIDKLNSALPVEFVKLNYLNENNNRIMNSWDTWKHKYKKQIEHVAGYEEAFVDKVLSQISEIEPVDVVPQYHFIDDNGGNRYIDFMIINERKGYYLPIELDGTYKDTNHQRWKDFLIRQNSLITKFGIVLRFSNNQLMREHSKIIKKIRHTLHTQSTNKITEESKNKERERLRGWYDKKLNELEQSNHNHEAISAEICELRALVEEIKSTPKTEYGKELVDNNGGSKPKSGFWLGVSTALAIGLFSMLVLLSRSDVSFMRPVKPADLNSIETKEELTNTQSIEGVGEKPNPNGSRSIDDWVEVSADELALSHSIEVHDSNSIAPDQTMSLLGTYQVVCGIVREVKAFSKGSYLNFDYRYPNTEFRIVVWDSDVEKVLGYGENFQHFINRELCVSGEITSFGGQPQIIVKYSDQLERK
ncbi:hypothetical protein R7Z80_17640 [Vibrio sp. 1733]|uniref:hypothetical protein n=1 Tax=unclassified Vibrio TaxID=2614977 RepID=UPI002964C87C|nr:MULTISPECIES: hypothetical protein [unclassified Vibrio]MDG2790253.1 hypothetical protein [Vibrio parahaemolyticus]MDW2187681.1 hypothetical protein [Vibrio sp. 1733]MDW2238601.1 hypothetical protein [Vibrio sp. 1565-1]MDW3135112.1 hypothetical protein [Vibrio sp. 1288]